MDDVMLDHWRPARRHPESYPGDCPDGPYVILDDRVLPLSFARSGDPESAVVIVDGEPIPLDPILSRRGLPALSDRHISLAYGANRNPGTLSIKMHNYAYRHRKDGLVLPVLKGATSGEDVVACGLSGQGYLYADLLVGQNEGPNQIEAWFPLLDADQLRVMHDGEHVPEEAYTVALFDAFLDGFDVPVQALGYAGNQPIFVSPVLGQPIAYSTVRVSGRGLPSMDATEMLEHVLELGRLRRRAAALIGAADDSNLVHAIMGFMNERWWISFNGETQPDGRYLDLFAELSAVIEASQRPNSTAAVMRDRGLALEQEDAYEPGPSRTIGSQLTANS